MSLQKTEALHTLSAYGAVVFKGTVSEDFLPQVSNHLPQTSEKNVRVISNFFENSVKIFASQSALRYQRLWKQIFATGIAGVIDTGDK
jgi:hypothetical protein